MVQTIENIRSKKLTKIYISKEGSDTNSGSEESPFLTISGVNVSSNGDTVLVGGGTYYENIEIMDKDIHLASLYLTSGDTSHISTTIIDGSQHFPLKSTVTIGSSISQSVNNVKLTGLTITGGGFTNTNVSYGAGIRADIFNHLNVMRF